MHVHANRQPSARRGDSMKRHGPWTIIGSRPLFADAWINVHQDEVIRPDGKPGTHDVVELRHGVTVIAVDEQLIAHLTEEFHYAVGRVTLEGVSGGRDGGEEALPCAKRELREELGIKAAEWLDLGPLDPVTSIIVAPVRLFLARK